MQTTEITLPKLGPVLRAKREEMGLSQREVSIKADVTSETVSNLERGEWVSARTLQAVSKALGFRLMCRLEKSHA